MKEKLKIAMFGQKRIPSREGGIEIVVEELSTRMVKCGYEVTCYNRSGHHVSGSQYDKGTISEYKGVKIKKTFTIDKKGLAAMTSSFNAALKTSLSDADIVHIHAEGPAAMSMIPKLFKKRVIVTIHGLDWARSKWSGFASKYIKWGEKQAVKYADAIIVLNKDTQQYFKKEYNRETVFIPNGVNRGEFRKANEINKKWGLTNNSYILYLGRIVPEKGLDYLVEAWQTVKTDKKLVIVGGSSDTQDYLNNLKEKAENDDRILFTGFQQGTVLEELYSNAYVYVLPSDLEGMPLSLLEAMSYGNCCLVSDIPECTEVVMDKATIFKKSDVSDLSKKIQQLIDDEQMVLKYKHDASDYICNKYSWDDVVKKTLDLYCSL